MIELKSFSNSNGWNIGNLLILTVRRPNWSFSFHMKRCVCSLLDPNSFQQHQQRQIFPPIPRFGNSDQFLQSLAHTKKVPLWGKIHGQFWESAIGFYNPVILTAKISCNQVIPVAIFGIPTPVHIFNSDSRGDFA